MRASVDEFTAGYIECALWASIDDLPPWDDYTIDDLAPSTLERMCTDCAKFQADNVDLLEQVRYVGALFKKSEMELAGHDFWLTRNRHGSGFWDGSLPAPIGNALTKASHAFGEFVLYLGDDGKIYHQ